MSRIHGLLLKQISCGTRSMKLSQTPNVSSHTRRWTPHHIQDLPQELFKDHQVQVTNHGSLAIRMIALLRESATYHKTCHWPSAIVQ
jgi:hypothetical protein